MNHVSRREITCMLGSCCSSLLFGMSYMFTKRIVDDVSVFALLSWRFLFGAAVMTLLILLGIIRINLKGKSLWPLIRVAFFMPTVYFIFETFGVQLTTASESGTIMASIPVFTLIASALLLKETPTRLQIGGILISTGGLVLIVLLKQAGASLSLPGYLLLFCAVCSDVGYFIQVRRAEGYSVLEKTYVMCLAGAAVFTVCALTESAAKGDVTAYLTLPFTDTSFLASSLYLGCGCTTLAFLLTNRSLTYLGPTRTAAFAGLSTVVSVISGVVFLHEPFSFMQGLGTFLVLLGVYCVNILSPMYYQHCQKLAAARAQTPTAPQGRK